MRTWIKYIVPAGSENLPPTILSSDLAADHDLKVGDSIWVKPECSYEKRTCIVKKIELDQMCPDGLRANVFVVQPLSTFN
jgi:hypothetical protein